ncbi:KR domain-containing protein [Symbioplanes lichenis]|uniref:KR domain-containing protein n=1 Tax=Symbioplanes lichenis TaxID=1629072 RepID=UPI002739180B|nr:KR domain-containing protein [Actinoplanes lichenis]
MGTVLALVPGPRPLAPGAHPPAATEPVVIRLGAVFGPGDNTLLLDAVRHAWWQRRRLVLIHSGAGGAALLRSSMAGRRLPGWLCAELPPLPSPAALRTAHALAASDLTGEVLVDGTGASRTSWRPVSLPPPGPGPVAGEAVLVTGGLGGLGIRVAGLLAHRYGCHPVLLDRARPAPGSAADRHLDRLRRCVPGATVRLADVTDPAAVDRALTGLPAPVRTVVHCAGVLGPAGDCGPARLRAAQDVKVAGLRHVLAALDRSRLRRLVVFGSVLAELPPHDLGCYALANELLRRETLRAAGTLPRATTVVAEWDIWSGAGMAHDLGVVPQARQAGHTPVALVPGLRALTRLLALPPGPARTLMLRGGNS